MLQHVRKYPYTYTGLLRRTYSIPSKVIFFNLLLKSFQVNFSIQLFFLSFQKSFSISNRQGQERKEKLGREEEKEIEREKGSKKPSEVFPFIPVDHSNFFLSPSLSPNLIISSTFFFFSKVYSLFFFSLLKLGN